MIKLFTKNDIKEMINKGMTLEQIDEELGFEGIDLGFNYKSEQAFILDSVIGNEDTYICYIPEYCYKEMDDGTKQIDLDSCYTRKDFNDLTKDKTKAEVLFHSIEGEHPSTLWEEWGNDFDLGEIATSNENIDPLLAFIKDEVPFRIKEVLKLDDVSDDIISQVIDAVDKNTDVMFDYDKFDSFIEEQYEEIMSLSSNEIEVIRGELNNLKHEINQAAIADDEILPFLEKKSVVLGAQLNGLLNGVEIGLEPTDIIDLEHLDCFWYGGQVGTLEYKGYTVSIEVHGDVRLTVLDDKCEETLLNYNNRNNSGAYENAEVKNLIPDDETLHKLCDVGRVAWSNNNWVEYRIFDPNDKEIDTFGWDNVLDNNVFDAFDDVSYYKEIIDKIIQQKVEHSVDDSKMFVFDEEILVHDDYKGVNGYLWATDALVERLSADENMENINFYVDYNLKTGEIKLTATYDTPAEDGELCKSAEITLTNEEKVKLTEAFEQYCHEEYGKSCLALLNEERVKDDLESLNSDAKKPNLSEKIQVASARVAKVNSKIDTNNRNAQSER